MNRLPVLFIWIFIVFGSSWLGLVAYPYLTFATLKPNTDESTGEVAPLSKPGTADQGYRVYAASGCVYCHTQQVRDKGEGRDLERGYGARRTVARDYIHDKVVFLGTMRTGPDLTNIGVRQPDVQWHYRNLWNPRSTYAPSIMPPYKYLFKVQKIVGQPSATAVKLEGADAPPPGYEVIPTEDAQALVAYLLSLKHNYPLPEAPEPTE
jgi:cytochrome c oxidase cbb3-type subunit II